MSNNKNFTKEEIAILDKRFKSMANHFARGNKFLAEELRNEAWVGALNVLEEKRCYAFCTRAAKNKVVDYLRSKKLNNSYRNIKKHVSFEAIQAAGFQFTTNGEVFVLPDNTITMEGELRNTYPWIEDLE